jgi:AcrR family transcriptional regulator
VRSRIIGATFDVLMERGYAGANTREIARQAKVSKRELYALFGSKQAILTAMIAGRSRRMQFSSTLPAVRSREALAEALTRFGATLVREVCDPAVMALFRLAVVEAERSPEVARALDEGGRKASRATLADFLAGAQAGGLISGAEPETMTGQFFALLWGDLLTSLLMRVAEAPEAAEIDRRAGAATRALLALYPGRQ